LQESIKEAAWNQITEFGAPTLSLRAIARELGITAPAIYHYFPNRDALVTALIIDAYTSFGNWQIAARDAVPEDNLGERMVAVGLAYRSWALAYPQRYHLIFGTPIPGYEAPMQQVQPSAARSLCSLVSVVYALRVKGNLKTQGFPEVNSDSQGIFETWKQFGGDYDLLSVSVALLIWAHVHGLVSLEIAKNLPPFGPESAALYRYELELIENQFIKS